jgi:hypothetical protein
MGSVHEIAITIADILIEVKSPLSAAELGIQKRLGDFLGAKENSICRILVNWQESEGPPTPRGEIIYDPGSILQIYRVDQEYEVAIGYPRGNGTAKIQAVLKANSAWDDLTLTEQRFGLNWRSLLNIAAGELILRAGVLFANGLVFHAAGIDDNGRGILYVGHSGEGKSTQANFLGTIPGTVIMNEDRVAVRSTAGRAVCYGTPWGGSADIALNHSVPLSVIILLEQAQENSIEPIPSSISAPLLLARAFLPYWDHLLMEKACTNLNAILDCVPVYRLRCRPEPSSIHLVRSVL